MRYSILYEYTCIADHTVLPAHCTTSSIQDVHGHDIVPEISSPPPPTGIVLVYM